MFVQRTSTISRDKIGKIAATGGVILLVSSVIGWALWSTSPLLSAIGERTKHLPFVAAPSWADMEWLPDTENKDRIRLDLVAIARTSAAISKEQDQSALSSDPVNALEDRESERDNPELSAANPAVASSLVRENPGSFKLINLAFDLKPRASSGSIQLRKRISSNGQLLGEAELQITGDSEILISTSDLSRFLSAGSFSPTKATVQALARTDFIELDELRSTGLEVRYDALKDSILLN